VQPRSDRFASELDALASETRRLAESITDVEIRVRLIEIAEDLRSMVSARKNLSQRMNF
jgi:hypothetical protein